MARSILTFALLCIVLGGGDARAQPAPRAQAEDDEVPPQGPRSGAEPYDSKNPTPRIRRRRAAEAAPDPEPVASRPQPGAVFGTRGGPGRDPTEDLLVRSQKGVTLGAMVDELVDELAYQLSREDPRGMGPVAVRLVRLSPNLRPSLQATVEAKLVARISKLPGWTQVVCVECRAVRSRVEGDDWVVTLGAVTQSDLARIGRDIGAKTFLEIDLSFTQAPAELILAAKLYRASDGHILFASAIKGDETTAAILRTGKVPPSREEMLADLKRRMEQRPYFGVIFWIGFAYIGADGAQGGYMGASPGVRLYERFGRERRHMYGIQGEGMIDWAGNHTLFGGAISAGYWYSLLQPNLNRPDLRIGGTIGGFIAGTDGNSVIAQAMAEYVLQFRLAISASVGYMLPVKYTVNGNEDLGGLCAFGRFAFNW